MKRKIIIIILFPIFFISCATSSNATFSSWYNPWIDINTLHDVITLKEGQEPKIIRSNNIDDDFFEILSNHYFCIGDTSFNGPDEDHTDAIKKQCKQNGAIVALYGKRYTDTRSGVTSYGKNISSYNIRRYDFIISYFIPLPSNYEYRLFFGIDGWDLTEFNLRQEAGRNTGVYVNVVYKDTPAFYANILRGDVIISINGNNINNTKDFYSILSSVNAKEKLNIEYIRKNQKYKTKIELH